MSENKIIIKTAKQIKNIAESGKYLTELLAQLREKAKVGVSLIELEEHAEQYMQKHNVKGAFKNYQGFPANLCTSVNDCVVHGIPDEYVLKNGDVLKVDCGVIYEKGISDSAFTTVIGGELANPLGYELSVATKKSLDLGIKEIGPGRKLYSYAKTVKDSIKNDGFAIIEKLTGHGVGVKVHERPYIYNRPHPDTKKIDFLPGMVVALEPITAIESNDFVAKPGNQWNLYTQKGDLGGHWEYMLEITDNGYNILSGLVD